MQNNCRFKGTEPSPKGLGFCAHLQKVGDVKIGKNGNEWVVKADKNGTKSWKEIKGSSKIPNGKYPKEEPMYRIFLNLETMNGESIPNIKKFEKRIKEIFENSADWKYYDYQFNPKNYTISFLMKMSETENYEYDETGKRIDNPNDYLKQWIEMGPDGWMEGDISLVGLPDESVRVYSDEDPVWEELSFSIRSVQLENSKVMTTIPIKTKRLTTSMTKPKIETKNSEKEPIYRVILNLQTLTNGDSIPNIKKFEKRIKEIFDEAARWKYYDYRFDPEEGTISFLMKMPETSKYIRDEEGEKIDNPLDYLNAWLELDQDSWREDDISLHGLLDEWELLHSGEKRWENLDFSIRSVDLEDPKAMTIKSIPKPKMKTKNLKEEPVYRVVLGLERTSSSYGSIPNIKKFEKRIKEIFEEAAKCWKYWDYHFDPEEETISFSMKMSEIICDFHDKTGEEIKENALDYFNAWNELPDGGWKETDISLPGLLDEWELSHSGKKQWEDLNFIVRSVQLEKPEKTTTTTMKPITTTEQSKDETIYRVVLNLKTQSEREIENIENLEDMIKDIFTEAADWKFYDYQFDPEKKTISFLMKMSETDLYDVGTREEFDNPKDFITEWIEWGGWMDGHIDLYEIPYYSQEEEEEKEEEKDINGEPWWEELAFSIQSITPVEEKISKESFLKSRQGMNPNEPMSFQDYMSLSNDYMKYASKK